MEQIFSILPTFLFTFSTNLMDGDEETFSYWSSTIGYAYSYIYYVAFPIAVLSSEPFHIIKVSSEGYDVGFVHIKIEDINYIV